jgi:hypothetical protein
VRFVLPLILLIILVVVMAGGGRRADQTRSIGLVLVGIVVAMILFILVLMRTL